MNKIKRFLSLTICLVIGLMLLTGCKGKDSESKAEYSFFGNYIAQNVVYSITPMQGTANSSYEISGEKFVIYSADKTSTVDIAEPSYKEKVINDGSIKMEYDEVDISKYKTKKSYDITDPKDGSSNYRIYVLDDEIWFSAYDYNDMKEQEEIMYIYSLKASEK